MDFWTKMGWEMLAQAWGRVQGKVLKSMLQVGKVHMGMEREGEKKAGEVVWCRSQVCLINDGVWVGKTVAKVEF